MTINRLYEIQPTMSTSIGSILRDWDVSLSSIANGIIEIARYHITTHGVTGIIALTLIGYVILWSHPSTRHFATLISSTLFQQPFTYAAKFVDLSFKAIGAASQVAISALRETFQNKDKE